MDQVWQLKKCLMKRSKECTYIALLDISKAYDTLDHDILARTLHKRGAEEAAVGIILKWYRSLTSVIHMNGQLFEEFLVERGVMQGGELVCMDLIGKLPLIAKGY